MAREPIDRYMSVALTGDFLIGSLTIPVATIPTIPAGETVYLTLEDVPGAPTRHEVVEAESSASGNITVASGGRGALNTTEQNWGSTDKISGYLWTADIKNRLKRSGDNGSVNRLSAEVYNNGASGAFDYNNGEQQKCTLTSAGTVISFTNIPEGGMCTAVITDADSFGPDITGLTWDENGAPTFSKITVIHAINANGTVRYSAGKRWSA